jgi:signal transduction histidine kinase
MIEALTVASRRLGWRDIALAVTACIGCVFYLIGDRSQDVHKPSLAACTFFFLIMLPVAWRRAAPLAAVGASLALLLLNIALFGEFVRCGILIPLGMVLVFSVGAQLAGRASWIGLGLVLAFFLSICLFDSDEGAPLGAMLFLVPVAAAVWAAGRLLHSRSTVSQALADRTAELREARDRRAELEIKADRARVSGELDELLQRRLGELAAMAEAGGAASDPAAAETAFHEIENESRRALEEMRTVVGVLRDTEESDGRVPQPTLTHLEALLLRARGGDARLIVEGNPRALPAGVELAAYRIVEYLLDTLEDVPVDVTVRFGDDALELAVSGPARRPNADAIKRAQERVQLYRGTLRSSTHGGRAESVASLPMLAGA